MKDERLRLNMYICALDMLPKYMTSFVSKNHQRKIKGGRNTNHVFAMEEMYVPSIGNLVSCMFLSLHEVRDNMQFKR
jgi:hypothetical protein